MSSIASNEDETINLLSLDGGGVRGVSALVILDEIMTKIKEEHGLAEIPKPCDFFHMIAGTSTGGLIAIMLGRLRMSTKEALQEYDNCAAKIFSSKNKKTWSFSERFQATALQEAVEGIVEKRGLGEDMWDPDDPKKGKVIVCVMRSEDMGKFYFVRSFSGDPGSLDNWDRDVKIWEAARATTAASSFFKPQKLGSGAEEHFYIDAAIGFNNPVIGLLEEAAKEFGHARRLGCVVSIGTGTRGVKLERASSGWRNLTQAPRYYFRLIKALKSTATDGEEAHRHIQTRLLSFPGAYYRFNVPEAAEQVQLHHYKKIPELRTTTANYLAKPEVATEIRQLAEGLGSDSFDHGLTLGLVHGLDKEHIFLKTTKNRSSGTTSQFFTGRQEVLKSLDSLFAERDTEGEPRRECLLHGIGGVGKTEVALQAGKLLKGRFRYFFLIDGAMPSTICQSYARICRQYNLGGGSTQAMQDHAMRWMEELTEEWLMVFDDCKMDDRRAYLPDCDKGNIIYTSRATDLKRVLPANCVFEITPFSKRDAVKLLLKASGPQNTPADDQNTALAHQIVKELGYLPLAIDKAAASMREGNWVLGEYHQRIRERVRDISSDSRFKWRRVENPAVYAALELSYEAIVARRKREGRNGLGQGAMMALKALGILSFYHYQEFPVASVFGRAAKERAKSDADVVVPLSKIMEPPDEDFDLMLRINADGEWNQHFLGVGLTVLERFSIIKFDPSRKHISMHVLVHSWARHRLKWQEYLRYSRIARIVINEAILVSEKWLDSSFSRLLAPHIRVVFARPASFLPDEEYRAHLWYKLGWFYKLDKQFDEAEKFFLACMHYWKMEFGCHDWKVIDVLKNLGSVYHDAGRLGDAELTYHEVVERIRERIRDCNAVLRLAGQDGKDGSDGRETTSFSRDESSRVRPKREPKPLSRKFLKQLAERPLKRLLDGKKQDPPKPDGEPVAIDRTGPVGPIPPRELDDPEELQLHHDFAHADLARVYMDQDRYALGRRWLIQVQQSLEEHPGVWEYSPAMLRIQHEVKALTEPGDLEYWEKRVNHMLDIEKTDGEAFWDVGGGWELMIGYANCLLKNRIWDKAYQHYRATLRLYERIHGPYDKKVLELLRHMVICQVEQDKCDQAVEIAKNCLHRARRGYGESHRETVLAMEILSEAYFYRTLEDDDEQVKLLRDAVARAEQALGTTHSITKRIRHRLTVWTQNQKRPVLLPNTASERTPKNETLDQTWQENRAVLEDVRAEYGNDHILVRRWARFVGDGPPRTLEELHERLLASFGSHNSRTQEYQRMLLEKQAAEPVEGPEHGPGAVSAGPRHGLLYPNNCICGEADHAEGSRWHERPKSETVLSSDGDSEVHETRAGAEPRPASPKPGSQAEKDSDQAEKKFNRFRNEPVYFCGL